MAEKIPQATAYTQIHSEFPHWSKYQVCMVPLIKQIDVIKVDVTFHCDIFVDL